MYYFHRPATVPEHVTHPIIVGKVMSSNLSLASRKNEKREKKNDTATMSVAQWAMPWPKTGTIYNIPNKSDAIKDFLSDVCYLTIKL